MQTRDLINLRPTEDVFVQTQKVALADSSPTTQSRNPEAWLQARSDEQASRIIALIHAR